ncbi:hypothetical protein HOC37_04075 [bacterium]|jgi:hypothetical protein|nr:hypothetical protein [bacterium]MBT4552146.1 hypothetical protein [bacterium]MBT5988998.1 hypothetical protein [bacterium]
MSKKIVALSEAVEHLVLSAIPSKEEINKVKKEFRPDYVFGREYKKEYQQGLECLLKPYTDEDSRKYPSEYCDWLVEKFSPALFCGGDEERDAALKVLVEEFLYGVSHKERELDPLCYLPNANRYLIREGQVIKDRVKSRECFCEKLRGLGKKVGLKRDIEEDIKKLEKSIEMRVGVFDVYQERTAPAGVFSINDDEDFPCRWFC